MIKTRKQVTLSITDCDYLTIAAPPERGEYNADYSLDYLTLGNTGSNLSSGFHPMARFITELSQFGQLLSAEHNTQDDFIRIDTLHETEEPTQPYA